jgi:hypothetical protein
MGFETTSSTFDMDDMMITMTRACTGSTTCSGPFDHGQMTVQRH